MRVTSIVVLLSTVFAAAPARAADEEPKEKEEPKNIATLKLRAAMSGTNASSFFDGYAGEGCDGGPGRLATFNFFAKKEQTEEVPAGVPLYVLGVLHVTPKAGEATLRNACRSLRSFTPELGRTYEITQDASDRHCPITIKDAATGAEVKGEKYKAKGACKDKK